MILSLGSAWRSEHCFSDFGLPRPARPESIEACDRAAKPGARAAAVRNVPDAQAHSRPPLRSGCKRASLACKQPISLQSRCGAAMLRHSSFLSLWIAEEALKA